MLLPDDTPESPTKYRAGPPAEQEDTVPPPAYPGPPPARYSYQVGDVEAQASQTRRPLIRPIPAEHYTTSQRHVSIIRHVVHVEPAGKRFLKAFGTALLIYLMIISLTRVVIAASWRHHPSHRWGQIDSPQQDDDHDGISYPQVPLPMPSDGKILQCMSIYESLLSEDGANRGRLASFLLPLSADVIYILGRGDLTHGNIIISVAQDSSIPDGNIRVDIIPHYNSVVALQAANICRVERAQGETGIAILTPSSWYPSNDLSFTVRVQIPMAGKKPLHVNAFETRLPLFTHTILDLKDKVTFGSIDLYSEHMPVYSSYLEAHAARIRTTNGAIEGTYHAYNSLLLETANKVISAAVTLHHDAARREPSSVTLRTVNGAIISMITLCSTASDGTGGAFSVSATTQNALLDLHIGTQPINTTLALDARTMNAPASVSLPPTYEGAFELGTTHGQTLIYLDEHAKDPAERGRSRVWAITRRMPYFGGWLSWGHPGAGDERRMVRLSSTNAQVKLTA